ncbi:hypothetical protein [Pseudonocardia sp. HH130630-07]|uniref:hypothetical protein n=1 Tax=Pseudonocardia sp. HH130630-07 TaxID=1690815 RepID=UPI0012EA4FB8|nr:hypothetical protein [Pseudonocardia sp. HH130630-07]
MADQTKPTSWTVLAGVTVLGMLLLAAAYLVYQPEWRTVRGLFIGLAALGVTLFVAIRERSRSR